MATTLPTDTHDLSTGPLICPFIHDTREQTDLPPLATSDAAAPEPPDVMVLYFMQGACLLPQSMQFCGILVARELVRNPHEINLVDFTSSRLSERQADKVIRAMNAVHTKNGVAAQWRPDDTLSAVAAEAMFKLRKLGIRTLRPVNRMDLDGAWGSVKSEGLGRLFSLARVVPGFPCREHLPVNARAASRRHLELVSEVLRGLPPDSAFLGLLDEASELVVHGQMLRDEKRAYRAAVMKYGSYTPQADACRDQIAAHFLAELQQRRPDLDWQAYRDYRH